VRAIASRPASSFHPGKPFSADFRDSADNRSVTMASLLDPDRLFNTDRPNMIRQRKKRAFRKDHAQTMTCGRIPGLTVFPAAPPEPANTGRPLTMTAM
jgi:hypothetical protein